MLSGGEAGVAGPEHGLSWRVVLRARRRLSLWVIIINPMVFGKKRLWRDLVSRRLDSAEVGRMDDTVEVEVSLDEVSVLACLFC